MTATTVQNPPASTDVENISGGVSITINGPINIENLNIYYGGVAPGPAPGPNPPAPTSLTDLFIGKNPAGIQWESNRCVTFDATGNLLFGGHSIRENGTGDVGQVTFLSADRSTARQLRIETHGGNMPAVEITALITVNGEIFAGGYNHHFPDRSLILRLDSQLNVLQMVNVEQLSFLADMVEYNGFIYAVGRNNINGSGLVVQLGMDLQYFNAIEVPAEQTQVRGLNGFIYTAGIAESRFYRMDPNLGTAEQFEVTGITGIASICTLNEDQPGQEELWMLSTGMPNTVMRFDHAMAMVDSFQLHSTTGAVFQNMAVVSNQQLLLTGSDITQVLKLDLGISPVTTATMSGWVYQPQPGDNRFYGSAISPGGDVAFAGRLEVATPTVTGVGAVATLSFLESANSSPTFTPQFPGDFSLTPGGATYYSNGIMGAPYPVVVNPASDYNAEVVNVDPANIISN